MEQRFVKAPAIAIKFGDSPPPALDRQDQGEDLVDPNKVEHRHELRRLPSRQYDP